MNNNPSTEKKRTGIKLLGAWAIVAYVLCILQATLGQRTSVVDQTLELKLFWSYIEWAQGNKEIGRQVILNIGLFAPFGFIVATAINVPTKRKLWLVPLIGMLLSVSVELVQLTFHLGLAELDDIVSNTLGTVIGMLAEVVFAAITKGKLRRFGLTAGCIVCLAAGVMGCLYLKYTHDWHTEEQYALCLSHVEDDGETLSFSGFAFSYDKQKTVCRPKFYLTADHLRYYKLDMNWGTEYPEVSDFYFGDSSHGACGLGGQLSEDRLDQALEYDLMVIWPGEFMPAYTGLHLSYENGEWLSRCVSRLYMGNLQLDGTDLEWLSREGELLNWREQYNTYLVQSQNQIYILVEQNSAMDNLENVEVSITLHQYPEGEKDKSCLFKEGELPSDINTGSYRVFCFEIPVEEPLKYIDLSFFSREENKDYWKVHVGSYLGRFLAEK